VRLVFAGTPAVAATALSGLLAGGHDVVGVITRPDAVRGRGRGGRSLPAASPVRELAEQLGLPVMTPSRLSDPGVAPALAGWAPDAVAIVAYGGLVPAGLLVLPAAGWVNLHFSLLPAWRGAAPVQWAVISGDGFTGASTFRLETGLDTGPVYGTVTEPIGPHDTSGDLLSRLATSGTRLLVATLDRLAAGDVVAVPQDDVAATYAPKLTTADAELDWAVPALAIDRRVRGCTPAPGAWTTWRGQRLKLGPVRLRPDIVDLRPGEVDLTRDAVLVGTGSHAVQLGAVGAAGRAAADAVAWARGARPQPHERLDERLGERLGEPGGGPST
jgi:methionyl-tRNA formyltransferase